MAMRQQNKMHVVALLTQQQLITGQCFVHISMANCLFEKNQELKSINLFKCLKLNENIAFTTQKMWFLGTNIGQVIKIT